jgi:hypothetical protein
MKSLLCVLATVLFCGCATVGQTVPEPKNDVCVAVDRYVGVMLSELSERNPEMSFRTEVVTCNPAAGEPSFGYGVYQITTSNLGSEAISGEVFVLVLFQKEGNSWRVLGEGPVFGFVQGSAIVWLGPNGSPVAKAQPGKDL